MVVKVMCDWMFLEERWDLVWVVGLGMKEGCGYLGEEKRILVFLGWEGYEGDDGFEGGWIGLLFYVEEWWIWVVGLFCGLGGWFRF